MRKIIGIGETVLDIIFRDDRPVSAVPGGSVYNSVISLGRAGANVAFFGEVGDDRIGRRTIEYLRENGVDASGVNMFKDTKSPLSLAFLNEKNDAEYIFYKDHPNDKFDFAVPDVQPDDIVLFGSYYAVNPVIRPQVSAFLEHAHDCGAILYYDVNFRPSHEGEVIRLTPNVLENLELADIVRGSHEDFRVIYKKDYPDTVYKSEVSFYCRKFIYTRGAEPLEVRGENGFAKSYGVAVTDTVSTIGAGDNFNAGFVYGMLKYGIRRADMERGLSEEQWDRLIGCAGSFSAECCRSIGNSISREFGESLGKIEE